MVWQGLLQSLAPLIGGALTLFLIHRRTNKEGHWIDPLGRNGVVLCVSFAGLIWLLPGGALLALPVLLGLSAASPAGREDWRKERNPRLLALLVAVLSLTATGFVPVAEPVSPSSWGQPLFTENPHAPAYPASQQYTWVTTDVVILQSIALRLPHQPGVLGAESTALMLASVFDMETSRMKQAIDLLDEEVPFVRLNADEVVLDPIPAPSSIDVRLTSDSAASVDFRRYAVKSTAFGLDASGTTVGEVITVASAEWGGTLNLLVIVRPLGHSSFDTDSNGEAWIREWLLAAS